MLTLLPMNRLSFDLTGYCKHPHASAVLTKQHVDRLLQTGVTLLQGAVPPQLCEALLQEAISLDRLLLDGSTHRSHLRSAWVHSDEVRRGSRPPALVVVQVRYGSSNVSCASHTL